MILNAPEIYYIRVLLSFLFLISVFYFKLSKGEVLSEKDKQSISGKQAEITKLYGELDTLTLNNNPVLVYS